MTQAQFIKNIIERGHIDWQNDVPAGTSVHAIISVLVDEIISLKKEVNSLKEEMADHIILNDNTTNTNNSKTER